MKSFKQVLSEVALAKSPADKEFIALHPIEKKQFVNYPEAQFKGGTKKDHSKAAAPSNATGGEEESEDEKPIDEDLAEGCELSEAKHRVGVTVSEPDHPAVTRRKEQVLKFVRVTADSKEQAVENAKKHYKKLGYKIHGAEHHSELQESVELQELSKKTLGSYIERATQSYSDHSHKRDKARDDANTVQRLTHNATDSSKRALDAADDTLRKAGNDHDRKRLFRARGIHNAVKRLTKEEVDLQELSKTTLKSYVKKATTSSERAWSKADREEDKAMSTNGEKYPDKQQRHMDAANKAIGTWKKREDGLKKAKDRLGK